MDQTFTASVPKVLQETFEFKKWFKAIDGSELSKIEAVKERVIHEGIITQVKSLGQGLYERKWKNGLRLYFAIIDNSGTQTILLLGSGKGKEQQKAIKKSYELLETYQVIKDSINYTVK